MQQTAFLEGRDLIVWVHSSVFLNAFQKKMDPTSKALAERPLEAFLGLAHAAHRIDSASSQLLTECVSEFGSAAEKWLMTLWHEQRHFVDYALTNYGASHFRTGQLFRSQLENCIRAVVQDGALACPVDVYADPVRLRALGIMAESEHPLSPLGDFLSRRREMLAQDRVVGTVGSYGVSLDGYGLLEALASLAQIEMVQNRLERSYFGGFDVHGPGFTRFPYLGMLAACAESAGFEAGRYLQLGNDTAVFALNPSVLAPLAVASLMCRRGDPYAASRRFPGRSLSEIVDAPEMAPDDQDAFFPSYRFRRLLHAMENSRTKQIRNYEDGFDFIDGLCRKEWGRSIIEDFDEDIEFGDNQIDKLSGSLGSDHQDIKFLHQYQRARRLLRVKFNASPAAFLGGKEYSNDVAPNVVPKYFYIDAAADGLLVMGDLEERIVDFCDSAGGKVRLLDRQAYGVGNGMGIQSVYCFDRVDTNEGRIYDVKFDDECWMRAGQCIGYVSLLMDGRSQVSGRDYMIHEAEEHLKKSGLGIRFDGDFDRPHMVRDPGYLFELFNEETLVCDLSGIKVTRENSVIVSPWDFYFSKKLQESARNFGKSHICSLFPDNSGDRGRGDWNSWLVHRDFAGDL